MTSGRVFEIQHPEIIAVNRSFALIFTCLSDDPELAKQREYQVPLLLTESVAPLEAAPCPWGAS
jgi:hypothetical protein